MSTIRIKGFQGTSLLDFPGRVASLVFTGGCNLTCPFCHNGGLVQEPDSYPDIPVDELLADLDQRRTFIDGVVVSGGEPAIDPGLPAFLSALKSRRLLVKLDTNGLLPEVVADLVAAQLVDYIALDVKTSPARYGELHPACVAVAGLRDTVALLKSGAVSGECRTTCIPELVTEADIDAIGELLAGCRLWVLQQYVPHHAMDWSWQQREAYPRERLEALAARAAAYVEQVSLRGV